MEKSIRVDRAVVALVNVGLQNLLSLESLCDV